MLIKIHSNQQPKFTATTVVQYNLHNNVKNNLTWYSEIDTDDYTETKTMLESFGYTAHPNSIKEIETKEYSIFQ